MVVLYMAPNKNAAVRRGSAWVPSDFNGCGRNPSPSQPQAFFRRFTDAMAINAANTG
jgi:hypothetical protein